MQHGFGVFQEEQLVDRVGLLLRQVALAVLGFLVLLIIEASPADAAGEEAVRGPILQMTGAASHAPMSALMLESHLQLSVSGLLARGTLTQRFRNTSGDWVEAQYLLPLPPDAAVTRLVMEVGERRIVGEIREREEARQVFDAARRAGKRSALLEQQRPHLFTSRVANVPPGEDVAVHVELLLPVVYHSGEFSLRFPTTVTTPYIPGVPLPTDGVPAEGRSAFLPLDGPAWVSPTRQVADAPLLWSPQHRAPGNDAAPLNPLSIDVALNPGVALAEVEALYHDLSVEKLATGFRLVFRDEVAEMDRDLVLRWRPRRSALPQAAVFGEHLDGQDYALLMVLPPSLDAPGAGFGRELILLLDVSGSMQGESIRQARAGVLHALSTLEREDFLNVVAFNDRLQPLFAQARPATDANLEIARRFVSSLQAGGGTEMLPALAHALASARPAATGGEAPVRQMVFLTDGAIGNEAELFELLAADRSDVRLFTVGIGSAPNAHFMHRAAELGRGEAIFISRPEEVAPQLNGLFERIRQPMAKDLRVDWGQPVEAFPDPLADLYAGQALVQVAELEETRRRSTAPVRVTGTLAGRAWERQIPLPRDFGDSGVGVYWARQKLAALLRSRHAGADAQAVRDAALPLALKFSLASPYTSFVAVEERPLRPADAPLAPEALAHTRPRGQKIAFAAGATSAELRLYLGGFLAFIALFGFAMNRPEP